MEHLARLRLSLSSLHGAGDLGHDGRLLGLAGLEDLGDTGQTARDVLRTGDASRGVLASMVAGERWHCVLPGPRYCALGHVVEVEDLAVGVFDDDLRVQVALVLDDDVAALRAAGVFLARIVSPSMTVLEADLAAGLLGQDRRSVRVPGATTVAGGRLRLSSTARIRRRMGTLNFSSSRSF